MPKKSGKRRAYHHGNLQDALIRAGLAIIESKGIEALSLRTVARRAKVSHAAPYHHFTGKSDLLAAIAAAGFDQMVETIGQQASAAGAQTSLDRLSAVGRGYLFHAVGHPSVFRLMFRPELTRPADHPRLMEAEARAFGTLLQAIVTVQQEGHVAGKDPRPPAAFAWSTVHGLAMLHIDEVLPETPLGQLRFEELAMEVNEAIISGLKSHRWK